MMKGQCPDFVIINSDTKKAGKEKSSVASGNMAPNPMMGLRTYRWIRRGAFIVHDDMNDTGQNNYKLVSWHEIGRIE